MGLALQETGVYTPVEYLELERASDLRHEYQAGKIFEKTAVNRQHNLISGNLICLVADQTHGRECVVYGSNMRIKISQTSDYAYADVVAICGEEVFEDETEDNLLNPMLIIEVLSKSTEAYDRGAKFKAYQTIESFREYVLVTQEPYRVEQFVRKEENVWTYFEFRRTDEVVKLNSISCELALRDIYHKMQPKFPREVV